jgi:ribosomal protein S6--L-glutamate ligase
MKIGLLIPQRRKYNDRRLAEEIRARGHTLRLIYYLECYSNISKNNPKVYYRGRSLGDLDAIIPMISIDSTEFGVALIRQFEMMGIPTMVGSLALSRARDKIRQAQIFARSGIDIPKTAFTNDAADAESLIKMVDGVPLIIKTIKGSAGNGVMLLESKKSARSTIEAFFSQSVNILIQEYIEESEGKDIRAFVIKNKVVASIQREAVEGEFRSNLYQGSHSRPIKLKPLERKLAIEAAKSTHLSVAGVDIIQSARGPLVSEVNACPNLQGIEETTGVNIASLMVDFVENQLGGHGKDRVGA